MEGVLAAGAMLLKKGFFDSSVAPELGLAIEEAGPGGGRGTFAGAAKGDVTAMLGVSLDSSWLAAGVLP